jgi:methylthioribose-1-phosphate isomerase
MTNTIEYRDGVLLLLDQRQLPDAVVVLECRRASEVADAIRRLSVRGAPAIGIAAAYGVVVEATTLAHSHHDGDLSRAIEGAADMLRSTRPTAVNLMWAIDRMKSILAATSGRNADTLLGELLSEAQAIELEDRNANEAMAAFGNALIPDGARVLTHCNAGALATGAIGTALGAIIEAHRSGKSIHVWVDETRPLLQGARLTAWELREAGVPHTLITDNMAGHFMAQGEIDLAMVGADRIAANGDGANKIGTYSVAVLAHHHGLPFYFVAPTSTVDLDTHGGAAIAIEERDSDEVTAFRGVRTAPVGTRAANPAFDVTPATLVTAIVTERGVVREPFAEGLRRAVHDAGRQRAPELQSR